MAEVTRETAKQAGGDLFIEFLGKGIEIASAYPVKDDNSNNWAISLRFEKPLTPDQRTLVEQMVADKGVKANIEDNVGVATQHGGRGR